ncbi:hypothetical protein BACCOPRO_01423 [Phocaeicola coprophilus DSM 18228 = JCM 13818]|uniref:Uncharacterized protein n=1 Tax=Phocaeicola coprophilus DSM 18228 = JCM 13818 TaxID=547042 RepID=S0F6M5_9BACT|nr:hypothetical protein BACCOPRO_01423 [Phocaeicola coprophilus DSM 18228 = JCM 13818]
MSGHKNRKRKPQSLNFLNFPPLSSCDFSFIYGRKGKNKIFLLIANIRE